MKRFFLFNETFACVDYTENLVYYCYEDSCRKSIRVFKMNTNCMDPAIDPRITEITRQTFLENFNTIAKNFQNINF